MSTTAMKSLLWVALCLPAFVLLGQAAPAAAQPAAPASAADVARLQADVARLERELREQKQLFMQMMQADQQRYDMILQLIRAMPAGQGANLPAPSAPAAPAATGPGPAAAAPSAPASSGPAVASVSGQVTLPPGVDEAYVYFEGRLPTRARAIEIKQQGKQFSPQVSVVPVGSKVSFPNTDAVFHNVFSRSPALSFDLGTVKAGEKPRPVTLPSPGHIEIFCNIHSRMRADVLVVPNGFFTRVKSDGSFTLAGVPVGSRKLVLWGPTLKPATQMVDVRPGASVNLTAVAAPRGAHKNKDGEPYRSYDE